MFNINNLLYIPKGLESLNRIAKAKLLSLVIVSAVLFIIVNYQNTYRNPWLIYLLGILPMMVAFSDKIYVNNKLKKEFSSLVYALYKGNIIWMGIYIISVLCVTNKQDEVFLRIAVILVYWTLSIIISVIYNKVAWITILIGIMCISIAFLYWMKNEFNSSLQDYLIALGVIVIAMITSVLVSYKQIQKLIINETQ